MTPTPLLYHGTRRGFRPGGLVVPRSVHGKPGTMAPLNPGATLPADAADWVYVTTDPELAWVYAWHAPGRGKPKVLTVLPARPLEPDPECDDTAGAYRCQAARVVAVDTTPMMDELVATTGWAFVPYTGAPA